MCRDPEVLRQVQRVLDDSRNRIAQGIISGVAIVLAVRAPLLFFQLLVEEPLSRDGGHVAYVALLVLSTVLVCRHRPLGRHNLAALQAAYMLGLTIIRSPAGAEPSYSVVVLRAPVMVGSLFVAFIGLRTRVVVVTSIGYHLSSVWLYSSIPPEHRHNETIQGMVTTDIMVFCAKVAVVWAVESSLEASALREVEAMLGKCQSSAVSSVLGLVCDAVVSTDSSLTLVSENNALKSLLMHGDGKQLQGVSLKSFVVDEAGLPTFEASIGRNTAGDDGAPTPGMFRGHLRDAIGNHIEVVFYHVPYRCPVGSMNHMIGIRESACDDRDTEAPPRLPDAVLREDVVRRLGELRSSSKGARPWSARGGRVGSDAEAVKVDVMVQDRLPVHATTRSFRRAFGLHGRSDGNRFLADILPCTPTLAAWIAQQAAGLRGSGSAPCIREFGEIAVDTPEQLGKVWRITAYFPKPPEDGSASYRVSLGFRDVAPDAPSVTSSERSARGTPASLAAQELSQSRSRPQSRVRL